MGKGPGACESYVQARQRGTDFGLRDRTRRAAVSIVSDIAGEFGRKSDRELSRYLIVASGSVAGLQSLLYVTLDVGFIEKRDFNAAFGMAEEIAKIIFSLGRYLQGKTV